MQVVESCRLTVPPPPFPHPGTLTALCFYRISAGRGNELIPHAHGSQFRLCGCAHSVPDAGGLLPTLGEFPPKRLLTRDQRLRAVRAQ